MAIDHYKIDGPAVISFSGGATSGYMLWRIIQSHGGKLPGNVVPVFANTGLEHPKTYDFIKACEDNWSVKIRWIEYSGNNEFVEVDYQSASRNGEPFSSLIEKTKRLPSIWMRFCTGDMKVKTIRRFAHKVLGFTNGYTEAIGLRYDEQRRVSKAKSEYKSIEKYFPMYHSKNDLKDVEGFWDCQPFKLGIDKHLGNCVGCFLKSRNTLSRIAIEEPEHLDWWVSAESKVLDKGKIQKQERFRSDGTSYKGLIQMAQEQQVFCFPEEDMLPCACTD